MKIESGNIDLFNPKNWNICCCGSEKCALSHGVGVSQGPVHDCSKMEFRHGNIREFALLTSRLFALRNAARLVSSKVGSGQVKACFL